MTATLERNPIVGGWKVVQDKTVEYRGYKIKNQEYGDGVYFTKGDYDAEWTGDGWSGNATTADSVEHAIELIDKEIAETQNTYVFLVGRSKYMVVISADSLDEASQHPDVKTRGTLFSVNKVSLDKYKFPR